ncbi:hypothetical protein [Streptomyces sp. TE33382]
MRSTPGSASLYVALPPSSSGAGSFPYGQVRESSRPACRIVTNGLPASPPEKDRATAVALGTTVPSARRTRVVSMSTQLPSWKVRMGSVYSRAVKVPSGSA